MGGHAIYIYISYIYIYISYIYIYISYIYIYTHIHTYNEMGTLNNMGPNDQPPTIGAGAYWNGSNRKTLPFNTPNVGS